jgi:hypothetical protein
MQPSTHAEYTGFLVEPKGESEAAAGTDFVIQIDGGEADRGQSAKTKFDS